MLDANFDGTAAQRRRPTQREVAERAAVSTTTVSYVLSGRRDRVRPVTDETRDRVLRAVRELGYHGNHAARSLRRQRTEIVCVVLRPPSSPWLEALTEQLHASASVRGYAVITLPIGPGDPAESALRVLRAHYVDGAILAPDYYIAPGEVRRLAQSGLALVAFDDDISPRRFDAVRSRRAEACYAIVDHLITRGHRRIAYLAHTEELRRTDMSVRYASYRRALSDHGLRFDETLVVPAADARDQAYMRTRELMHSRKPPSAVFSASDRGAINAIWAIKDLGLSVPDDVAVAGVGNTAEGAAIAPALTTAGIRSVDFTPTIERLWARLDGKVQSGTELEQPWELIVRAST